MNYCCDWLKPKQMQWLKQEVAIFVTKEMDSSMESHQISSYAEHFFKTFASKRTNILSCVFH